MGLFLWGRLFCTARLLSSPGGNSSFSNILCGIRKHVLNVGVDEIIFMVLSPLVYRIYLMASFIWSTCWVPAVRNLRILSGLSVMINVYREPYCIFIMINVTASLENFVRTKLHWKNQVAVLLYCIIPASLVIRLYIDLCHSYIFLSLYPWLVSYSPYSMIALHLLWSLLFDLSELFHLHFTEFITFFCLPSCWNCSRWESANEN